MLCTIKSQGPRFMTQKSMQGPFLVPIFLSLWSLVQISIPTAIYHLYPWDSNTKCISLFSEPDGKPYTEFSSRKWETTTTTKILSISRISMPETQKWMVQSQEKLIIHEDCLTTSWMGNEDATITKGSSPKPWNSYEIQYCVYTL